MKDFRIDLKLENNLFTMQKILIPTDFSENASNAIRYAVNLWSTEKCTFYLVHTYTPTAFNANSLADSYSAIQLEEIMRENAENELQQIKADLKKEFNNPLHTFKCIVSFNLLVLELLALIETKKIDMIIMGTQGATGAKEIFIGTHTTHTLKKVNVPVIAVPSDYTFKPLKDILFPTDYKFHKKNPHLAILKKICKIHDAELHLLNVYGNEPLSSEQQDRQIFLNDFFKNTPHLFHIDENTDVVGAITKYKNKSAINLLAMVHNKHSFFENLLFKPVINQVAFHINVPFLVLPSE